MSKELEKKLKEMVQAAQIKINELAIQSEKLDREYHALLKELDSTPEELKAHAENRENYSQPIWEFLQNEKASLQARFNADLESLRDLKKVQKSFSERKSIQPHWIHVR